MTFRRFMGFVAMAFLWTGSQIPVYLFGGIPPIIYGDIGGVDRWVWFVRCVSQFGSFNLNQED